MNSASSGTRATFNHMEQGTREEWAQISAEFMPFARNLPERVLHTSDGWTETSEVFRSTALHTRYKPRR